VIKKKNGENSNPNAGRKSVGDEWIAGIPDGSKRLKKTRRLYAFLDMFFYLLAVGAGILMGRCTSRPRRHLSPKPPPTSLPTH